MVFVGVSAQLNVVSTSDVLLLILVVFAERFMCWASIGAEKNVNVVVLSLSETKQGNKCEIFHFLIIIILTEFYFNSDIYNILI